MIGRGAGGRGRSHIDERDRRSRLGSAPSSRHLWVGSLSHNASQSSISELFARFGEVENISYIPGRTFAFVNYKHKEDAEMALRGLNGYVVSGLPLKIEFAKADRASVLPQEEDRVGSLSRRDLRPQEASSEKSKSNKNAEPCEILWIGFPPSANIDETALRRAFQPFGEIDKISAFPGRSYAFVRFRSIAAACRAKESLQGKLFNNPRVSICFARNDSLIDQGRGSASTSFPHHTNFNFNSGTSLQSGEPFGLERSYDSPIRGEFRSNMDIHADEDIMGVGRNSLHGGPITGSNIGGRLEHGRFRSASLERRLTDEPYEYRREDREVEKNAPWLDFSFNRTRRAPSLEDSLEMESSFPLVKKLKADKLLDNELPEYPFSDMEAEKWNAGLPKHFRGMPEQHGYHRSSDILPPGFNATPEYSKPPFRAQNENNELWRNFDGPGGSSTAPFLDPSKLQRLNSESHQPPLSKEWKWEGTIAKGGTPVCHARCFPVGKVLDFVLPEVLDCTARTGLDMLSKHYYQAANSWVVFFVPQNDADITFYNDFMNYLGEKQRAAVAKLGEKISLFLVPPSDFSEQVLKVPGKVSISGVILKFQQTSSSLSSPSNRIEATESKPYALMHHSHDGTSSPRDTPFLRPSSPEFRPFPQGRSNFSLPSGQIPPTPSYFLPPPPPPPLSHKPSDTYFPTENFPDKNTSLSSNWFNNSQISSSSFATFPPSSPTVRVSSSFDNYKAEDYPVANPKVVQGTSSSSYLPGTAASVPLPSGKFSEQQENGPPASSALQVPLQPEQLAQLAVLLAQQKQSGNVNLLPAEYKQQNMPPTSNSEPQASAPRPLTLPHGQQGNFGSHSNQAQQLQQKQYVVPVSQQPTWNSVQQSSQQASNNTGEENEAAGPQMRLQATLQLAAALLQQINQQAKP